MIVKFFFITKFENIKNYPFFKSIFDPDYLSFFIIFHISVVDVLVAVDTFQCDIYRT